MKTPASSEILGNLSGNSLFDEFFCAADVFSAMQQEHQGALLAGNCKDLLSWQQGRERAFRGLVVILEKIIACGQDNGGGVARAREIMGKLLAEEKVLEDLIVAWQLKLQSQLHAMRKGKEALQGYNINKGLVPRPRYLSNRM